MIDPEGQLARRFKTALEQQRYSVDAVAERTKVPRSTVLALIGSSGPAILPQRIYLRGHVAIVARDLGVPVSEAFAMFDAENPVAQPVEEETESRFNRPAIAIAAALCSIGVIAVILAFVS